MRNIHHNQNDVNYDEHAHSSHMVPSHPDLIIQNPVLHPTSSLHQTLTLLFVLVEHFDLVAWDPEVGYLSLSQRAPKNFSQSKTMELRRPHSDALIFPGPAAIFAGTAVR